MRFQCSKEVTMTSNQIAFAVHKENQRHNKFAEREGKRHNLQSERIGESNVALGYANLNEMFRHNYASEGINQQLADVKGSEAETHAKQAEIAEYNAETERRKLMYDAFGGMTKVGKPLVAAGYAISDYIKSGNWKGIASSNKQALAGVEK